MRQLRLVVIQIFSEKTLSQPLRFYTQFLFYIYVLTYVCKSFVSVAYVCFLTDMLLFFYVSLCFSVIGYLTLDCVGFNK